MTQKEIDLVAALESDIQTWEFVARFFEHHVADIETIEGQKMSGRAYAEGMRSRIAHHRALIDAVKKG